MSDKRLWKWHEDLYYGTVTGVFIATESELKLLFENGATLYLGEVAGKHSEVDLDVNMETFTMIPASEHLDLEQMQQFVVGHSPINWYIDRFLDDLVYCISEKSDKQKYLEEEGIEHLKEYLEEKAVGY